MSISYYHEFAAGIGVHFCIGMGSKGRGKEESCIVWIEPEVHEGQRSAIGEFETDCQDAGCYFAGSASLFVE